MNDGAACRLSRLAAHLPGAADYRVPDDPRTAADAAASRAHLAWLAKKHALRQDAFLVGPPGPLRRHVALAFCHHNGLPVHYVALSRDTTESDLKQRKELSAASLIHADQPPLVAALSGHVLILEGIEHVERNVLPVLNNLLENREMHLNDGRFLVRHDRYDAIPGTPPPNLLRCHPDFRVICVGLPVPPYRGQPLDPPLRSRFQARLVTPPPPSAVARLVAPPATPLHQRLLAFYAALGSLSSHAILAALRAADVVPFASASALALARPPVGPHGR